MKIQVKESDIEGFGVFAGEDIRKGALIYTMRGMKVSIPNLKAKYESGKIRIDDPFQISDRTYLILEKPGIYFNHSCNPNAGIHGTRRLIARRDIHRGEEITYDYSTTEWTDDKAWGIDWYRLWRIPCRCGSRNCRKTIRMFPTLPRSVQMGYFRERMLPDFIMKKMEKSTKREKGE